MDSHAINQLLEQNQDLKEQFQIMAEENKRMMEQTEALVALNQSFKQQLQLVETENERRKQQLQLVETENECLKQQLQEKEDLIQKLTGLQNARKMLVAHLLEQIRLNKSALSRCQPMYPCDDSNDESNDQANYEPDN